MVLTGYWTTLNNFGSRAGSILTGGSRETKELEALGRVELPTNGLGNRCSIHLSYRATSFEAACLLHLLCLPISSLFRLGRFCGCFMAILAHKLQLTLVQENRGIAQVTLVDNIVPFEHASGLPATPMQTHSRDVSRERPPVGRKFAVRIRVRRTKQ